MVKVLDITKLCQKISFIVLRGKEYTQLKRVQSMWLLKFVNKLSQFLLFHFEFVYDLYDLSFFFFPSQFSSVSVKQRWSI